MARKIVWTGLTLLFVAALVFFLGFADLLSDELSPWIGTLPNDPHKAALAIMKQAPVIVRAFLSSVLVELTLDARMDISVSELLSEET